MDTIKMIRVAANLFSLQYFTTFFQEPGPFILKNACFFIYIFPVIGTAQHQNE